MTLLIELPPEILEIILKWLDSNSLYLASLSCKTIRTATLSSRSLLYHHLCQLPGYPVNPNLLTTAGLGNVLQNRLQDTLLRGVDVLSDRACRQFTQRHLAKASLFQPCRGCSKEHCMLVLVDACDASIDVYSVDRDNSLVFCYSLSRSLLAAHLGLKNSDEYKLEVLKVAIPAKAHKVNPQQKLTSTLVVLCRYSIWGGHQNRFVLSAAHRSKTVLKLMKLDGNCVSAVRDIHVEKRDKVLGLAVNKKGKTAAIALRNPSGTQQLLTFSLAGSHKDGTYERVVSGILSEQGPDEKPFRRQITDLQVSDDMLLLHSSFPIAEWYTDLKRPRSSVSSMQDIFDDEHSQYVSYACGPSFATQHRCHWKDVNDGLRYCLNASLFIGMKLEGEKGPYIVKSLQYPDDCEPLKVGALTEDTSPIAVAKLQGYDNLTQTSIGPILAVSRSGTRIAIAVWKRLLVWAIDPQAFLNPFEDPTVDVEAMDAAGDPGYTQACGHFYYRAYERVGNVILLPPIELQNDDAVVHKLAFVDEDILYGMTDKGLVSWEMRPGCARRRFTGSVNENAGCDVRMQE